MLPMPNDAKTVKSEKSTASHFMPRPCSSAYIGPPSIVPSAVLTRYFTASSASLYLVAMPSTPVSHIQRTAPGPPRLTAVDADDISRADRRGQRCGECSERT